MKKLPLLLFLIIAFPVVLLAQKDNDIPDAPNPPRLVNDFAGVLNDRELNTLEQKLRKYHDTTSTQIAVVIMKNINGNEPVDYAVRLGEKWGVGQKQGKKNNGIVVLVSIDDRKDAIVTGYGMEGSVTDVAARRIRQNYIHPNFKQGKFYEGLDQATTALIKLASGEFKADDIRATRKGGRGISFAFIIFIFIIIFILSRVSNMRRNHYGSRGASFWTWLWLLSSMGGGGRGGSHWGGGGGSSSGGSDFGGFGGGSFGGGGSGGDW